MEITINIPDRAITVARRCVPYVLAGAAVGATTYLTIGGLGLAGLGNAIGINLGKQMLFGAGVAGTSKLLYEAGRLTEGR